ncbi:hypothetical protein ACROYT_G020995 [Oculina patagonica]
MVLLSEFRRRMCVMGFLLIVYFMPLTAAQKNVTTTVHTVPIKPIATTHLTPSKTTTAAQISPTKTATPTSKSTNYSDTNTNKGSCCANHVCANREWQKV